MKKILIPLYLLIVIILSFLTLRGVLPFRVKNNPETEQEVIDLNWVYIPESEFRYMVEDFVLSESPENLKIDPFFIVDYRKRVRRFNSDLSLKRIQDDEKYQLLELINSNNSSRGVLLEILECGENDYIRSNCTNRVSVIDNNYPLARQVIFEYKPEESKDGKVWSKISEVRFDEDDNLIILTSKDMAFKYNFGDQTLNEINYPNPKSVYSDDGWVLESYEFLSTSPNGRYDLFQKHLYEGTQVALVDKEFNELIEVPRYIGKPEWILGLIPLVWEDQDTLILRQSGGGDYKLAQYDLETKVLSWFKQEFNHHEILESFDMVGVYDYSFSLHGNAGVEGVFYNVVANKKDVLEKSLINVPHVAGPEILGLDDSKQYLLIKVKNIIEKYHQFDSIIAVSLKDTSKIYELVRIMANE